MRPADQFRFVRQNMKKNKTRLFMTVLATAMGCAFLIVLASVGFGLKQSIVDNIVGDRLVTAIDVYGKVNQDGNDRGFTEEDLAFFRSIPQVKAVTYRNYVQQSLNPKVLGQRVNNSAVLQVDFAAETLAGFELSAGRMPQSGNEIIVGYHIRKQEENPSSETPGNSEETAALPDASEWLNEKMQLEVVYYENGEKRMETTEATIVGVAKQPSREWQNDQTVYVGSELVDWVESKTQSQLGAIPYPESGKPTKEEIEAMPKLSDVRKFNQVQVIASQAKHVKGIAETLREKEYYNHSIANELEQVNMMFMIMTIGLIFVGTIAVLIASIGIFNTMTMAVTERAQDIGIMKAIGAHPAAIRKIFLLESSMIGVIGAIVGTVVAYLISIVVNAGLPILIETLMNERVPDNFLFSVIPPYLALLACLISLGVAMLSGYRPAKRATKIDVLRALRRDM